MDKEYTLTKSKLIDLIKNLYETEVGDFRRKVSLYLNNFDECQSDLTLKKSIKNLQNFILYTEVSVCDPMETIDQLRWDLLERLKKL